MSPEDSLRAILALRDWSSTLTICALILAAEALFFLVWGLVRTRSHRLAWITGVLAGLCAVGSWVLARQALVTYQILYDYNSPRSPPPGYVDPYPQWVANALALCGTAHWVAIGVVVAFGFVALGLVVHSTPLWPHRQHAGSPQMAS